MPEAKDSELVRPQWDSQLSTLSMHMESMQRFIPKKDSAYDELVRTGCYIHTRSGKTVVPSAEFAKIHSVNGVVVAGTYDAPATIRDPTSTALSDDLKEQYMLGHGLLVKKNYELLQEYLLSIDDVEDQDDYERAAGRSGLKLILLLNTEAKKLRHAASTTLTAQFDAWVTAGLTDASTTAFNAFRKELTKINRALKDTGHYKQPMAMANLYLDAVRDLGNSIALQLDMELAKPGVAGDFDKTVAAIKTVLSDQHEKEKRASARALRAGGDPPKGPAPPQPPAPGAGDKKKDGKRKERTRATVWSAVLGDCRHCGKPGHLNRDCPSQKEKPPEKPKEGAAKLARSETGSTAPAEPASALGQPCDDANQEERVDPAKALFGGGSQTIALSELTDPQDALSHLATEGRALVSRGRLVQPNSELDASSVHSETDFENESVEPELESDHFIVIRLGAEIASHEAVHLTFAAGDSASAVAAAQVAPQGACFHIQSSGGVEAGSRATTFVAHHAWWADQADLSISPIAYVAQVRLYDDVSLLWVPHEMSSAFPGVPAGAPVI